MTRLSRQILSQARPLPWGEEACVAALLSGGDSRIAPDPATGLNKYLCAPAPSDGVRLASCTASPISQAGFSAALSCHREVSGAATASARGAAARLWQTRVEQAILGYLGAERLADAQLLPSGTDGVLWTACMLAREAPGRRLAAILPAASETGTGVPLAAACRGFDAGPGCGAKLADAEVDAVHVPLRDARGAVRGDDELNAAFAAAAAARARPVVYLTHGSKTGLVAPLEPPAGAEVVVDACQMRLAPSVARDCLRRGWPVVVTGSKMLGGPPFSGAVLFPRGRFPRSDEPVAIGPLLRWVAALDGLRALADAGEDLAALLARRASEIERVLEGLPGVELAPGPSRLMCEAAGWPASIVTFTLRDPSDPSRRLAAEQLRPLHRALAAHGALVGQPVELGRAGGLRLAVAARDAAGFGDALGRFADAFRRVADGG